MDTQYLIGCYKCKYFNTKHPGCNYDDFMRELGFDVKHKINDNLECSVFDKKND